MSKHTPGPWLFRGKSSSVHEQPENKPGEKYTYGKQIFRFRDDDDEVAGISDEDLALILAAPDMLAALEAILPMLPQSLTTATGGDPSWTDAIRRVESAIEKARGAT
jgi:hypothetical protein